MNSGLLVGRMFPAFRENVDPCRGGRKEKYFRPQRRKTTNLYCYQCYGLGRIRVCGENHHTSYTAIL